VRRLVRWEFSGLFKAEGIAFKISFLLAFGYTLKHGALFYGQKVFGRFEL